AALRHGYVEVAVVASGDIGGVVHAAAVVGPPAFIGAGQGPDLSLPDEVLDAQGLGVVLHPVRHRPPGFQLLGCGSPAERVAEGDVTSSPERVLAAGAGSG